jgi:hypothetical protein
MPIIPAVRRLREEDEELEASLGKKFMRPSSPSMAGYSGTCLSFLAIQEAQIGLWSSHKVRPYLKK